MDNNSILELLKEFNVDLQPFLLGIARSIKNKIALKKWISDKSLSSPWYLCEYALEIGKKNEAVLYLSDILKLSTSDMSSTDFLSILNCLSYFNKFKEIEDIISNDISVPFEDLLMLSFNYTGKFELLSLIKKFILKGLPNDEQHLSEALVLDNALIRYFSGIPSAELISYVEQKVENNNVPEFYSAILSSSLGYVHSILSSPRKEKYIKKVTDIINRKVFSPDIEAVIPLMAKNLYACYNEHVAWKLFLRSIHDIEISSDVLSDVASISVNGGLKALTALEKSESIDTIRELYFAKKIILHLTYEAIDSLTRYRKFDSNRIMSTYLDRLFEITNEPSFSLLTLKFAADVSVERFEKQMGSLLERIDIMKNEESLLDLFRILGEIYISHVSDEKVTTKIQEVISNLATNSRSPNEAVACFVEGVYHESLKRNPFHRLPSVL
ncbi:MAG: hypothetical protein ACP6IS_08235 [Candidatus Asgardarchaeia archaeon]